MFRRLGPLLVVLTALVATSAALGAYPTPFASQGSLNGVASTDGSVRFIARKSGSDTIVSAVRVKDGSTVRSKTVAGAFGIPMLTQNGLTGGLFRDGNTLVLQSMGIATTSKFTLVGTQDLAARDTIALDGIFGFDALSPDGSKLYLIQHMTTDDLDHYVVRAYDLKEHALVPGRIADKTQKNWIMQGFAVDRTTSKTGRWVYTLYSNPGGFPVIHALDTVNGVAHCIGLPWRAPDQSPVYQFKLSLKGHALRVRRQDGRTYRVVDTRSWRLSVK
jgi:hypothetical protein